MKTAIVLNTVREKIRKKQILSTGLITAVLLFFFVSGNSTITIGNQQVTELSMLLPIYLTVGSLVCGLAAILLSAGSIPAEYERKSSYLVSVRDIPQSVYHVSVAAGNSLAAAATTVFFYLSCLIFLLVKQADVNLFLRLPAAFLLTLGLVVALSFLTTGFSVKLPPAAAGVLVSSLFILGMLKHVLTLLSSSLTGALSVVLKRVVRFVPDFYGISSQSANYLIDSRIDWHSVFLLLLTAYAGLVLLWMLRRKEA